MMQTESVGLDEILKEAGASAPFERLLAASGPVRRASAAAPGHAFAAVVLAHALGVPVLAIGHDPRVTDALAAGAAAFLGHDRVVRFPAWESLPYEGISPSPQVAGARARAAHRLRTARGPMVVSAPALAAIQGLIPTLGRHEPLELRAGASIAPDALADRLVALGYA